MRWGMMSGGRVSVGFGRVSCVLRTGEWSSRFSSYFYVT